MKIDETIHIDASPDIVWSVTMDLERWPEWTPTVTFVRRMDERPFGLGSVATIKQPMQPESEWVVTDFVAGRRFAWTTRRRGLSMTGTHEILTEGTGTKNVLRIEAGGAVAVLLWPLLRVVIRRALSDENRGLKVRCERIAQSGPIPRGEAGG